MAQSLTRMNLMTFRSGKVKSCKAAHSGIFFDRFHAIKRPFRAGSHRLHLKLSRIRGYRSDKLTCLFDLPDQIFTVNHSAAQKNSIHISVQCRSCLRTALDAGEACSLEKALVGSAALLLRAD